MIGVQARPSIVAVMGSTGSGKSAWIKRHLLKPAPARLLVWDYSPVREYESVAEYVSLPEMVDRAFGSPRFALAYQVPTERDKRGRAFDVFCRLALAVGRCTVLVEELRYVTQPSRSPDPWAALVMTGRKAGCSVIGTSQRPAHVDKDFLGNATVLHCGCLGYDDDVTTMAREMRLLPEDRDRLLAMKPLEYLHKDRETGNIEAGKLVFRGRSRT